MMWLQRTADQATSLKSRQAILVISIVCRGDRRQARYGPAAVHNQKCFALFDTPDESAEVTLGLGYCGHVHMTNIGCSSRLVNSRIAGLR